tara:strand:- start:2374 stop:5313 length:2940 start_codon:yes stop_codon:yes gene_type:complete
MACLQYYYENPQDAEKYAINCDNKIFQNLNDVETFNNKDLLEFIEREYSGKAFPENSPFEFKDNYIELSNNEICKSVEMSLAPQQKFMGHIMGPSSNFNNMLIFHGLGSGKSCTSIVVGEALKNASNQRLLFVVPAPLVDQYYEEIAGEIRNGKFFSCPSFCLVRNGGKTERDFYVSQEQNSILIARLKQYETQQNNLYIIQEKIDAGDNTPATAKIFRDQENKLKVLKRALGNYQKDLRGKIIRTFEIVTHQTFIESIYKTGKLGQLIKGPRLLQDTALFHENGLLIIDEIQRLVSEGGIFYKKLYNAIKYYFHPKLRIAVMSATPVYDNPYELALTINLLRPRVPFPINKTDFYKFFVGKYNGDECVASSDSKSWISEDSCIINKDLIRYICSGYVSYFKGGNPNAYPYKRIITMEHTFSAQHKLEYISALKSDVSKDKNFGKKTGSLGAYENVLLGNYESESEDKVSGMYVTTQQYSNIFLPKIGENVNKTLAEKKQALRSFKSNLISMKFKTPEEVINHIKVYSSKFASIIELALNSSGPVFIFSNWLTYGVEPLAIILEACGLTQFDREDRGNGRYFIWSSETKSKDRDGTLIKKARNTFNSNGNSDGSQLKIILGTRSVMEGVSFKNVKQVHITEPWWNESRIEQILARASRYCSHSSLPINDQYVDIYRHYSVLPTTAGTRDEDVAAVLGEIGNPDWQGLSTYGIDQKMLMSSLKKYSINNELELVLKSCAIDSEINKNGNIIRLEEHAIPSSSGLYQIFYKNPSNGRIYIREGIPENVTFTQIYNREFSFPNKDFPVKFTESTQNETGKLVPYPDAEILTEPVVNIDLNVKENIEPWKSSDKLKDLKITQELRQYVTNLYQNYTLLPLLRKSYFNEIGSAKIKFKEDPVKRIKLIKCIKELSVRNLVSSSVKREIAQQFSKESQKQKINSKVLDLIYRYNVYPESYLEELLEIAVNNPESINQTLKTVSGK